MECQGDFSDLLLNTWILEHLKLLGFNRPTPIQYNCIPPILNGEDCFGCSKTGTGKTAAFALPILQKLSEDPYGIFCLVLAPTRELAYQIAEQFSLLGKPINVRLTVVIGEMDMLEQASQLHKRPHIVVATPGRLADHIRSNNVKLNKIKFLVIDEADRLLNKVDGDFAGDLNVIFNALPKDRQTLLFSATLTDTLTEVKQLSTRKPFFWQSDSVVSTVNRLDQYYVLVPEEIRNAYLVYICKDLLEKHPNHSIMIFTKTCKNCQVLGMMLQKAGFQCVVLHSVMKQRHRLTALSKFKSSNIRLLIATDVAARGLDIPVVQVVINHNVPGLAKNYIHRVGRTARAGRSGMAVTLTTMFDIHRVLSIEKTTKTALKNYEVNEDGVVKILTQVNIMQREAEMTLENRQFGDKKAANKRKALILEGKDPRVEAKKERRRKIERIKEERKMRRENRKRSSDSAT